MENTKLQQKEVDIHLWLPKNEDKTQNVTKIAVEVGEGNLSQNEKMSLMAQALKKIDFSKEAVPQTCVIEMIGTPKTLRQPRINPF